MTANVDQRLSWPRPMGVGSKGTIASATSYGGGKAFNDLFGAILKADERTNKAEQILPWQMAYSEETLANIFALLKEFNSQMLDTYRSSLTTKETKNSIKNICDRIKKIKKHIKLIAEDIGKMKA